MKKDQRETKDWINAMARHMGISASRLALNSNIAASTLARYLNDESGTIGITQSTLEQIAGYTGFRPHQFPGRNRAGFAEPDAVPFANDNAGAQDWVKLAVDAARKGRNGIEAWVMKGAALDALGVLPGDVVIIDHNLKPRAGDIVVAQVVDYATGSAETVMRVFQPPFVMGHSIRLGPIRPEHVDEDRVTISGTSIGILRARH